MKRVKELIILILLIVLSASCIREIPQPISTIKVGVILPANIKSSIKYASKEIIFASVSNTYKVTTDAQGFANITNLIPDEYNITTSWEITGAEYKTMINNPEPVEDKAKVLITAVLNKQQIYSAKDISLVLEKIVLKSLLISKVYFTGTKDNANKNYTTDAYIEIFNTSEETSYIDGKYIGLTESMSTPAYPAKDNPDFIYARQICKFPGTGKDYPIEPGKSIVIAAKGARDHRTSASTSVDLSFADFEVKDTDGSGNPDVKALPLVSNSTTVKFLNLLTGGGNGVFLFETSEDIMTWPEVYAPGKTSGERFRKIPTTSVLDGVECLKNNVGTGPDVNLKRLQFIIDAGYTFVNTTSGYTHESLERKVVSTINGVVKIKDSNNSTEDFVITLDPTPKKYDKPELIN